MAVNLTGPVALTVVPTAFRSTMLLNVTVARRRCGVRARIPSGDSSIVMVPATACHLSGSIDSRTYTSEQKSN
jgi:hypothetical protein